MRQKFVVSDPAQCRALQDQKRKVVLDLLIEGPKDATEIAEDLGIPHDEAARHLKILSENQLIQVHRMQRPGKDEPSFQAVANEYEILFTGR